MAGREDWYRNENWSPEIEKQFNEKLKRTRSQGPQYLCIQANILAKTEPRVALRLLERYFARGDEFDMPRAFGAQADTFQALNLFEEAIQSYKSALTWEQTHHSMMTNAYLDLPFLIASRKLSKHYDLAMELLFSPNYEPLQRGEQRRNYILMFPIHVFMHAYALALIHHDRGNRPKAIEQAARALASAKISESPFPRHRGVGLVSDRFKSEIETLRQITHATWTDKLKRCFKPPTPPE